MSEQTAQRQSLLPRLRVLDLTNERGYLCGRILADLGADVIKVESPGGDQGRRVGPFYHDVPDLEKGLFWFAYNTNKRSVTLNIESFTGRKILSRLVVGADILIESFDPDYLERLGLGYRSLSKSNHRLIVVSITPFGQLGPYAHYNSSDIILMAMGGFANLCGDADRAPICPVPPQSFLNAGADAAVGAMIAYHVRELTGQGQQVDISIQQSVALATYLSIPYWELSQFLLKRYGNSRLLGTKVLSRMVWPCSDGHVCFVIHGGATGSRTNSALAEWMEQEGMLPEFMRAIDWSRFDLAAVTEDAMNSLNDAVSKFFLTHTKAELYEWARQNQAMLYPVLNCQDLLESTQLSDRHFWQRVHHPELSDMITYPGGWVISSETDLVTKRRAPLIGEHNEEIYSGELGITRKELLVLEESGII